MASGILFSHLNDPLQKQNIFDSVLFLMTIEYRPTQGFTINGKALNWGDDRPAVRKRLGIKYEEDDRLIDLSNFFNGDQSQNINVKRDLYGNATSAFSFHINYDQHHRLESIEIHKCAEVILKHVTLKFGEDLMTAMQSISTVDSNATETDNGEILYPELKMVVASSDSMGGDGNGLSYFYAAKDFIGLAFTPNGTRFKTSVASPPFAV